MLGTVKRVFPDRGYFFITADKNYYAHASKLKDYQVEAVRAYDMCEFDVEGDDEAFNIVVTPRAVFAHEIGVIEELKHSYGYITRPRGERVFFHWSSCNWVVSPGDVGVKVEYELLKNKCGWMCAEVRKK